MQSFKCPILYVYGNWDHSLAKRQYVSTSQLLHFKVIKIGRIHFTGFSGCPTSGATIHSHKNRATANSILNLNRGESSLLLSLNGNARQKIRLS